MSLALFAHPFSSDCERSHAVCHQRESDQLNGVFWIKRLSLLKRERLITSATHAIEAYLADRLLPLVVQRANGGCVVRPPAD